MATTPQTQHGEVQPQPASNAHSRATLTNHHPGALCSSCSVVLRVKPHQIDLFLVATLLTLCALHALCRNAQTGKPAVIVTPPYDKVRNGLL